MKAAMILGCGYTGKRLARLLCEQGVRVRGTTRDASRAAAISEAGAEPVILDTTKVVSLISLAEGMDVVFDMIPPRRIAQGAGSGGSGKPGDEESFEDDTAAIVAVCAGARLEKFVYLGSTGIYGEVAGDWIDEQTPVNPASPRARARHAAEETLRAAHARDGFPAVIVRAPGIYGPDRSLAHRIKRGAYRVPGKGDNYLNRIHVDDLAQILAAAALRGSPGAVYLATDDQPEQARVLADFCAGLLGLPPPPSVDETEAARTMGESNLAMLQGDKRLSNRRIKEELGVTLRYPTYREGIPASLEPGERSRS
ncbi:MAG: NAD-dependent epimerase/dehydratase family protein [Deltaproteobacteria bacterium]|nr:NAD-dependent epimerase/dehydratase family protein [Deltaproteobacteria bacterium]